MASSYTARYGAASFDMGPRPLGQMAEHSYLVCATPRSGSNLLADALRTSGGLGVPMEYLDVVSALPALQQRWGVPDLSGYIVALHALRTDDTGWLGLKAHWHQLKAFFHVLDPESYTHERAPVLRAVVEQLFPDVHWIHLRREDVVGAVVSYQRAGMTGDWVRLHDEEPTQELPLDDEVVERMVRNHDSFVAWAAAWERFFEAAGIEPLRLEFREVVGDVPGTVARVRDWLGVGPGQPPEVSTRKQSDDWSRRARERLVAALEGDGR